MEFHDINFQIKSLIGKKVYIYIQSRIKLEGILCGFDQFMNLSVKNLRLFNKKKKKKIGTSLVRGHLVISIEASES
ncbi:putative small nuclear ribonucleoprotein G (nucleomorph) [Chroomonas mesostigmatica CCMP1168]|uniref:Putative small nuclear ribonucleoprotein G n=1 Tax=Chroomonas mesostigmatica CCMP1168 TaxID=1195612 RepID=J7GA23_9CRYP|nr:putative small nuclear ribonucleoprotein G [Chroomonas mesostigmatica CCMP1168]